MRTRHCHTRMPFIEDGGARKGSAERRAKNPLVATLFRASYCPWSLHTHFSYWVRQPLLPGYWRHSAFLLPVAKVAEPCFMESALKAQWNVSCSGTTSATHQWGPPSMPLPCIRISFARFFASTSTFISFSALLCLFCLL